MHGIAIAFVSSAILIVSPVNAADTPPHLDTSGVNLQPAYPASALEDNERGAAVIGVNVGKTGKVNYAYPLKTSGFDDLDGAAMMGAMGWRFVPATSGGKPVAGDTAVEIVFQPPDPPNATTQTAQPAVVTPQPKGDFLPASVQIQAARGDHQEQTYPALCPNGTFRSTVEFQHPLGAPVGRNNAAASLMVRAGRDDVVVLQLVAQEVVPPQETFILKRRQGEDKSAISYSRSATLGLPDTISLSWDSTGTVTGTVGAMETHEARLNGPPSRLVFAISSGAAKFVNSALLCRPG